MRFFPRNLALSFVFFWCAGCLGRPVTEPRLADVDHSLGQTKSREGTAAAGVVVESVAPGWPGEKAGLQSGDVILSWSCPASPPAFPQPSSGSIHFPYDLLSLEIEEAPRRGVTLRGKRGDQEMVWVLTTSEWRIEARPIFPPDLAALYLEGKVKTEAGDVAAAERIWRSAAESARTAGNGRLAAWFLDRLARALARAKAWPKADTVHEEAFAALERVPDQLAAAQLLYSWGASFQRRAAWDAADERYQKALALTSPKSLAAARTLNCMGVTAGKRGDYLAAEELLLRALAIREEVAPGTTDVTGNLNNLGIVARRRGDLTRAEEYLTRGEELQRRLAPESADHALFFQNLGNLAKDRGDLEKAEGFHRQALAIFEKVAPGGGGGRVSLHNLANVTLLRGDLATAEDLLRRSLALEERADDKLHVSTILISLGIVASRRGDLEAAEVHYRRALTIQEKLAPEGWETASSLSNMAIVLVLQGDFSTARAYLQRSLSIREKLAPGSLDVAATLEHLGRLETNGDGDLATAEDLLGRALTIYEREAPENLDISEVFRDLGEVAFRRGRLPEALAFHRQALELQHKLAPGTTGEAEALYFLGRAERRADRAEEGIHNLCRAIDILDRQRQNRRASGSEGLLRGDPQ